MGAVARSKEKNATVTALIAADTRRSLFFLRLRDRHLRNSAVRVLFGMAAAVQVRGPVYTVWIATRQKSDLRRRDRGWRVERVGSVGYLCMHPRGRLDWKSGFYRKGNLQHLHGSTLSQRESRLCWSLASLHFPPRRPPPAYVKLVNPMQLSFAGTDNIAAPNCTLSVPQVKKKNLSMWAS